MLEAYFFLLGNLPNHFGGFYFWQRNFVLTWDTEKMVVFYPHWVLTLWAKEQPLLQVSLKPKLWIKQIFFRSAQEVCV